MAFPIRIRLKARVSPGLYTPFVSRGGSITKGCGALSYFGRSQCLRVEGSQRYTNRYIALLGGTHHNPYLLRHILPF